MLTVGPADQRQSAARTHTQSRLPMGHRGWLCPRVSNVEGQGVRLTPAGRGGGERVREGGGGGCGDPPAPGGGSGKGAPVTPRPFKQFSPCPDFIHQTIGPGSAIGSAGAYDWQATVGPFRHPIPKGVAEVHGDSSLLEGPQRVSGQCGLAGPKRAPNVTKHQKRGRRGVPPSPTRHPRLERQ